MSPVGAVREPPLGALVSNKLSKFDGGTTGFSGTLFRTPFKVVAAEQAARERDRQRGFAFNQPSFAHLNRCVLSFIDFRFHGGPAWCEGLGARLWPGSPPDSSGNPNGVKRWLQFR